MESHATETDIARLKGACGCEEGAAVALAALVAYAGWAWFDDTLSTLQTIALGGVVFVVAGGAGKFAGLFLARRRLRRLVELLARRLTTGAAR
jgi:hypothetical protein